MNSKFTLTQKKDETFLEIPSNVSSNNLRQLLALEKQKLDLEKFKLKINLSFRIVTLVAAVILAIYFQSIWPLAPNSLAEAINYLKQFKLNKSP